MTKPGELQALGDKTDQYILYPTREQWRKEKIDTPRCVEYDCFKLRRSGMDVCEKHAVLRELKKGNKIG